MNISDIISEEYVAFTPETPVSKLAGTFADPAVTGVVVRGDAFEGVVTRRQLATSNHPPDEHVGSLVAHAPRLAPDADVREVARLMLDSDAYLLPVFEGRDLVGVVTADGLLRATRPYLDAVTVADTYTPDLVSVGPTATVGEALHLLREHRFTHLPVVDDGAAVGILSLYDLVDVTVRAPTRSQGGRAAGTDPAGGTLSVSAGRTHGGGGAREGESTRLLDLPVRDVMVTPVRTVDPAATLQEAVTAMFDVGGSSLVVTEDGRPTGIVTKTDVLDALTWEAEGNRAVQVYGADLLDDVAYTDVVALVDRFDDASGTTVLDAKVHLQDHDETFRGTPLILARVRLATDDGLYVASGEGYGARHALDEARDVLLRQLRDETTRGRSKKHPDEAYWERRFGWLLEE